VIAPAAAWRVAVWPDKGPGWIEWSRNEADARALFAGCMAANIPAALVMPDPAIICGRTIAVTNVIANEPIPAAA